MPTLSIRRTPGPASDLTLDGPRYTVGRAPDNDIVLPGSGVSRRHCELVREGDRHRVRDLGSQNGVRVNGTKIEERLLAPGDEIRIGPHLLIYEPSRPRARQVSETVAFEADYEALAAEFRSRTSHPGDPGAGPITELQRERRTLALLCDLSHALSTVSSLDDVARKAVEILLETTKAERGAIFLLEETDGGLRPVVVCERSPGTAPGEAVALSSTVSGRILTERKGIITADATTDPRFAHGKSVVLYNLRSICCAPLVGKGGNLGILYLENNQAVGVFTQEDLRLLCAVAAQIGLTIENARFFDALRRSNEDLERQVEERTAALRDTQLRLYQTEKILSLSRLVAGVTHEINSPLGALQANLQMLQTLARGIDPAAPDAARESWTSLVEVLDESIAACSRIPGVVRSLRSYARLEESEYKVASVNDGLAAAADLLDPGLRGGVVIDLRLGSVPSIPCFPALLNEAFMNVLINACQACRGVDGGRVAIESRLEGSEVVIEVRDNGVGIASEHIPKIFDPGFTTKGVGVGLGLGLSVAYLVIREHGGTIRIDSEPGSGTTVTVRLPS